MYPGGFLEMQTTSRVGCLCEFDFFVGFRGEKARLLTFWGSVRSLNLRKKPWDPWSVHLQLGLQTSKGSRGTQRVIRYVVEVHEEFYSTLSLMCFHLYEFSHRYCSLQNHSRTTKYTPT